MMERIVLPTKRAAARAREPGRELRRQRRIRRRRRGRRKSSRWTSRSAIDLELSMTMSARRAFSTRGIWESTRSRAALTSRVPGRRSRRRWTCKSFDSTDTTTVKAQTASRFVSKRRGASRTRTSVPRRQCLATQPRRVSWMGHLKRAFSVFLFAASPKTSAPSASRSRTPSGDTHPGKARLMRRTTTDPGVCKRRTRTSKSTTSTPSCAASHRLTVDFPDAIPPVSPTIFITPTSRFRPQAGGSSFFLLS
mmetsp:Transcript_26211/g.84845  ORF Transcript_26211/g.84845 Transcript_26211/m.84845 type:complete len:251 (+) Transcript_26211:243-995(+)